MNSELVYLFLPPQEIGAYREAYCYGPDEKANEFHSDLGIVIDPKHSSISPALAVVSGEIRLIPDSSSNGAPTGTLVLMPSYESMKVLSTFLGNSPIAFVYRNIDVESAKKYFQDRLQAGLAEEKKQYYIPKGATAQDTADRFARGEILAFVHGGDNLALPYKSPDPNEWAFVGIEILFLPTVLKRYSGLERLKQVLQQDSKQVRRLDPTSFFFKVSESADKLAPTHINHPLLSLVTQRILLELRDEHDRAFVGIADVSENNVFQTYEFKERDFGTIVLQTVATSPPPPSATYSVSLTNYIFTELPSGTAASSNPSKVLSAPQHWALQSIFMADVDDPSDKNWFVANTSPLPRYTEGNKVTHLIDGIGTFYEMVAAMRTIKSPDHYLHLAGWWLTDDFPLIINPEDEFSTFAELTSKMNDVGAEIRVMLWDYAFRKQNTAEVKHINQLAHGKAILDATNNGLFGSHHQKLIVVYGINGAIGFCGGVDINPDRLDDRDHFAVSPFHDVHAKIEGPAVEDLNTTFVQRWNSHPDLPPPIPQTPWPDTRKPGSQYIQVTRTYGPSSRVFGPLQYWPFAPWGDIGSINAIRRAIQRANRFIYIEDQYAFPYTEVPSIKDDDLGIFTDLVEALERIEYLIMVIPNHTDAPQARYRRYKFIHPLRKRFPDKVYVFYLRRPRLPRLPGQEFGSTTASADIYLNPTPASEESQSSGSSKHPDEIYVHSKIWIVDDVYVKIGSSNFNRRGLAHDSEVNINVIDGALENGARAFARRFRVDLWGEHLNLPREGGRNLVLEDPTYALQFWKYPPRGAQIAVYDETAERNEALFDCAVKGNEGEFIGGPIWNDMWTGIIDPDGRS